MKHKGIDLILRARVGSHSYGTNIEGSDEDFKSVYIQTPESVLEDGYKEQIKFNGDDDVAFELNRFIELCSTGNPTMLELLYTPDDCIIYKHPLFDVLISKYRDQFLTQSCKWSFGGYAIAQIEKAEGLDKKMNWEKDRTERKTVLDFCYVLDNYSDFNTMPVKEWLERESLKQEQIGLSSLNHFRYTYGVFFKEGANYRGIISNEETSNDVCVSEIDKVDLRLNVLYFNKDGYSVHCKQYNEYLKWLQNRNTQRYVDIEGHGQKIDGKNMLHCVRLLETGIEIAQTGTIKVRRPNAEYLIEIRKGKHDLSTILKDCRVMMKELDEVYKNSNLPESVNTDFWKEQIRKIRKEYKKIDNDISE